MSQVDLARQMLLDNERYSQKIKQRYRTVNAQMQASMESRTEHNLLLDALEELTGHREFSVSDLLAPAPTKQDGGDDDRKVPVNA